MKIIPYIKRLFKTEKPVVVSAWSYPCGEWGTYDTKTKKSTYGGVLVSEHIVVENRFGGTTHMQQWTPERNPAQKQIQ